jgi:hypothetical protein
MKIDRTWLKQHNAYLEGIVRFLDWAGNEPRSLEEIAEHHPDSFDIAWIIDKVAPFDIRMDIACRLAGDAAGIFFRQSVGYERFAWNINPGNIAEAEAEARKIGALTLADLYHDASNGDVEDVLYGLLEIIEDLETKDDSEIRDNNNIRIWMRRTYRASLRTDIRDNLRTTLRVIEHAQTCPVERPLSPEERSAAAERVGKAYLIGDDVFWVRHQNEEGLYEALQKFIIRADEWDVEYAWMPCEYLMHPDQFAGAVEETAPQPGEEITIYRPLLGSTVSCLVGE